MPVHDPIQVLKDFIRRYGTPGDPEGPVRFAQEVLGVQLDPWQKDVLREYGRGGRRISISACHGPGKTATAAWMILHHLITKYPQKTVATAPSSAQLNDALFAEVLKWMRVLPDPIKVLFNDKSDRIELKARPEQSFFAARTARPEKPEALQGVHSENVLLVADEASGVPEAIFESAAGSMSGHTACTLLLSNPTRTSGFFFDTHHKLKDMWFTVRVSAEMSSRVSDDFVEDIARRYGRHSDAYRIRVEGLFPKTDSDTIIPFEFIEAARALPFPEGPRPRPIWALDVARYGDDESALVARNNMSLDPEVMETWRKRDTMYTVGRVKRRYDDTSPEKRPSVIVVDAVGMGAGVFDRLRELGLPVRDINVGNKAMDPDRYANLRTELWFKAREWLQTGTRAMPGQTTLMEQLQQELVSVKYAYDSSGREKAETKDDMKKRKLPSPNLADAFVLTFAEDAATTIHGSEGGGLATLGFGDEISYQRSIV